MNIGNKLYELRKTHKLSQEEVAEKLNVTRQTISKWETNQSMPDLDKIIPLCELYEISADTLLKGTTSLETPVEVEKTNRQEKAKAISISVFLYFLSVIWITISESIKGIEEGIQVGGFLLICAAATAYLIYKLMSLPRETKEKDNYYKQDSRYKIIDTIIALVFAILYLLVSFATSAWEITWILWLVYALVIEIIHSILMLKGDSREK